MWEGTPEMQKITATAFISHVEKRANLSSLGSVHGKTLHPGLVLFQAPFSTGLSSGMQVVSPNREEGKWLVLESRDLPCFCTIDSNQDTVFQPPFSLTELIPVHLQVHGKRGGEGKRDLLNIW